MSSMSPDNDPVFKLVDETDDDNRSPEEIEADAQDDQDGQGNVNGGE